MKVDLLNIEKTAFCAVLLTIERDFQRNYSELITSKEKFNSFCDEKRDKFIYPDGKKYDDAVSVYIASYLLNVENNKFQQILNSL